MGSWRYIFISLKCCGNCALLFFLQSIIKEIDILEFSLRSNFIVPTWLFLHLHQFFKLLTNYIYIYIHTHIDRWIKIYLDNVLVLCYTCLGVIVCECKSHSVVSDSLQPHGLHSPWNSLGQNTRVGSLSLLQGIFPTRGANPGLPHCRRVLYHLSHKGSPILH